MRNLDPRLYAFIYGAGSSLATFIVTFGTARLAGTALEPAFWISAVAAIAPYAIRQTEGIRDHNANKRADTRAAEPVPVPFVEVDEPYHRSPRGIPHPGNRQEGCEWCIIEVP